MAPLAGFQDAVRETLHLVQHPKRAVAIPAGLTSKTLYDINAISLSFATLSVFTAMVTFYWFVRMRRSFRQDLIMLLIQSDMMKAFWLMLCPIIYFIRGPFPTEHAFCQVSGFFVTAAIEGCDVSVLMIAVHTALYIFAPQREDGEYGLYPYRRVAYALWLIIPLILAALVPITGGKFQNTGAICYLPIQPIWYRTVLSWGPRFAIFAIIAFTYSFLYLYLGCRFQRLQQDQRRASTESSGTSRKNQCKGKFLGGDVPPTPSIVDHGLLDSPAIVPERGRQHSVTSTVSTLKLDETKNITPVKQPQPVRGDALMWQWKDPNYDDSPESPERTERPSMASASPITVSFNVDAPDITKPEACHPDTKSAHLTTIHTNHVWQRPLSMTATVTNSSNILSVLHKGPPKNDDAHTSPSQTVYLTQSATEDPLYKSREKTRRQLRLLFVYPLMYIICWISPFVTQVYWYINKQKQPQPFAMLIGSVVSLAIGAAVDCCFFSAWEKPWRNLRGGFWEGLAMRLRMGSHPRRQGRTQEEQMRDARMALDRRQLEDAEHEATAALEKTRPAKRPREWWDADEEDGGSEETGSNSTQFPKGAGQLGMIEAMGSII